MPRPEGFPHACSSRALDSSRICSLNGPKLLLASQRHCRYPRSARWVNILGLCQSASSLPYSHIPKISPDLSSIELSSLRKTHFPVHIWLYLYRLLIHEQQGDQPLHCQTHRGEAQAAHSMCTPSSGPRKGLKPDQNRRQMQSTRTSSSSAASFSKWEQATVKPHAGHGAEPTGILQERCSRA